MVIGLEERAQLGKGSTWSIETRSPTERRQLSLSIIAKVDHKILYLAKPILQYCLDESIWSGSMTAECIDASQ